MERWGNHDGSGPSQDIFSGGNVKLMKFLQNMMENQ